ncbi:DUF819 domain-containing protein [Ekhidna sp.]|uniref:DUF819 family protein n=1 Tax=Ekhidna sp. TaxID=2608089 RepID=UPI003B5057C4
MTEQPIFIIAVLFFLVFLSEFLCKHTFLKHISSSLLVIILGAIVANIGLIPSASDSSPVYENIFGYVAPASIFFLLLGVQLKELKKAGLPMLLAFILGSLGTMIGVIVALNVIDYEQVFGINAAAIAGMMTGTYTGGSANFNAVALHYEVFREGAVYTGVVVADNIITAIWMIVTLSLPIVMQKLRPHSVTQSGENHDHELEREVEEVGPMSLSLMLLLGAGTLLISDWLASMFSDYGIGIPSILILTTIALILAQFKRIQIMPGAKLLGMFSVYLFLAVVGAFCEIGALVDVGAHAFDIFFFTIMIVLIHGSFLVLCGLIFKFDWSIIAIASQANIGGASTALALAKSVKRNDLILPAILAGSLGSGLGTYLGFLVAAFLGA